MRTEKKWISMVLASGLLGSIFHVPTGCFSKLANNVNPCGVILVCDPVEYDLLFQDFPDYNVDPTCTIPGLCGGTPFPLSTGTTGTTTGT